MSDRLKPEQRSKLMSSVKTKGTGIELIVRKHLFSKGFRFRLNKRDLPGTPDIVLKKYRSVIFVNGCFWHGHSCPKGLLPKTNYNFWKDKIEKNKKRDQQNILDIKYLGWRVITVWECEIKSGIFKRNLTNFFEH